MLDVNVLLALGWAEHEHHGLVIARLHSEQKWAISAVMQLGLIRLSATPGIFHQCLKPSQAALVLQGLVVDPLHEFLTDRSQPSAIDWGKVLGNKQTNDRCLSAFASSRSPSALADFESAFGQGVSGISGRVVAIKSSVAPLSCGLIAAFFATR